MKDRRRWPRCELVLKVEYATAGDLRSDYLTNLSQGGLFLRTDIPLRAGDQFQLSISFPTLLSPILADVQVAWVANSGQTGVGLAFKKLEAAAKARLEELITSVHTGTAPWARVIRAAMLEPNPILREIFLHGLKAEGRSGTQVDLSCTDKACDLLSLLEGKTFDIALVDVDLLQAGALDVLGQIRTLAAHLPVVALGTAKEEPRVEPLGVFYVRKPVAMKPLMATIERLIQGEAR